MSGKMILLVLQATVCSFSVALSGQSDFTIVQEHFGDFTEINRYLGLYPLAPMPVVPFNLRSSIPNHPGNYFYSPQGANKITLSKIEKNTIDSLLKSFIDSSYFDYNIIEHLNGFEYTLSGKQDRREYYIRFMLADTIYAISGWEGKFISFYRAVPFLNIPSIDRVQEQARILCPSYKKISNDEFKKIDKGNFYFIEHIDYEKMNLIRSYLVSELISANSNGENAINKKYDLIEITKFLDKGMVP